MGAVPIFLGIVPIFIEELVFFAHMHSGAEPYECVKIVLDFSNGLTSCVHSQVGSKYMANEVSYKILFGPG